MQDPEPAKEVDHIFVMLKKAQTKALPINLPSNGGIKAITVETADAVHRNKAVNTNHKRETWVDQDL